ncbi:MAG TPA: hypothetical protein PK385_05575 [Spirochaetota bacterium]|nr:hypothetical protein [Spirochaetota bacterium]HOS32933.1 hypothetical protein [Spirochaetota bacterium]HOS55507.1 hypothetical protein [Spirochaetota bacterium]HQF78120.1 hypothetical protein [Spirochaetota bacterium]HQH29999.1 hypothetical protein [Spirochaetota bacterium]
MIVTHIEKVDGKVIVPLEQWNMIIAKLKNTGEIEIKEGAKMKSWKRKIEKVKIAGKPLSDTIIEERNENIF